MKNLLIIGASGFGRDIYDLAQNSIGYGTEFQIKGFLDLDIHALDNYPIYPNVISSEDDYEIQPDDVFVCALGNVRQKKKVYDKMIDRHAEFYTLIDKTARVSPSAVIGKGCILGGQVLVGSAVVVGENTLIQKGAVIGHDAQVGKHCRIDCMAMFVGGVVAKDEVTIHTSAVLNHKVVVENGAVVGACSFVTRKVKENTTVFGIPARVLEY